MRGIATTLLTPAFPSSATLVNTGLWQRTSNSLDVAVAGTEMAEWNSTTSQYILPSSISLVWSSTTSVSGSPDTRISRGGAAEVVIGDASGTDNTGSIGDSTHRLNVVHTKSITIGQSLANPTMGEVTLSGASATAIAYTTALTAGARIFLSKVLGRGTQGSVYVTSSTNGNQFTVQSTSTTDTSVVAWWVVPVS